MAHIAECIETEGSIIKIPSTLTGYVRRYCRNECGCPESGKRKRGSKYYKLIHGMRLDPESYDLVKDAFAGGFTHANALATRIGVMTDV